MLSAPFGWNEREPKILKKEALEQEAVRLLGEIERELIDPIVCQGISSSQLRSAQEALSILVDTLQSGETGWRERALHLGLCRMVVDSWPLGNPVGNALCLFEAKLKRACAEGDESEASIPRAYQEFDEELLAWSREQSIPVSTEYRDEEVRSFELVDHHGRKYQIWLELPEGAGNPVICAWDYQERRVRIRTSRDGLHLALDQALEAIREWQGK